MQCFFCGSVITKEDMAPTDQGRHDGRGCYPGCCPRPEGVEKKDKADPWDIGKGHQGEKGEQVITKET